MLFPVGYCSSRKGCQGEFFYKAKPVFGDDIAPFSVNLAVEIPGILGEFPECTFAQVFGLVSVCDYNKIISADMTAEIVGTA